MKTETGPLLVVAVTGRALAASARLAGRPVAVLDCFADRDTCALATDCRAVVSSHGLRFDRRQLLAAAEAIAPKGSSAGLVYGSGFEGRVPLLEQLATGRRLFGNSPAALRAVRRPDLFFPLLEQLGMAHPEVRYAVPTDPAGWVSKEPGGAGGSRVRPASRGRVRATTYFQRYTPGTVCSVLFLANRRKAFIVGFNQLWTGGANPALPYLYGGAVGQVPLPRAVETAIRDRLDNLVEVTGLVGLNGMDFILDGDRWWVLEVNPRPTATMELYDPDYERGLLNAHLRACEGQLPAARPPSRVARAAAIVHASHAWQVPPEYDFPDWCRDLPRAATFMREGDPVCSVHAEAETPEAAAAQVMERRRMAAQAFHQAALEATVR